MRKRLLAIVGCAAALLVLGVVIWRQSPAPPPEPPLNVQTLKFDFGRVRSGTIAHHDFEIQNNGSGPRILGAVTTSCGCTTVGSNMVHAIQPHSTGILPVDVNLKGVGGFHTRVYVGFTDDSSVTADLTGESVQQVPSELSFDAAPGKSAEQRFALQSVTSTPLNVKSLKCDSPDFEVSLIEPPAATAPADPRVLVRFHPSPSASGKIASELRIETDDAVQPVKVVALTGNIHQAADTK